MITCDLEHLAAGYPNLIRACLSGDLVSPRGKPNRELRPVLLVTRRPCELANAGVSYRFADAEVMAYLAGWNDVAWLKRFNQRIEAFSDDGCTFHGAYGKRLASQLKHAVAKLTSDKESRQVVLNIWSTGDLWVASKDLPCNTQLLLKLRDDALHLTAIVRSQDVIWGLPYDHHAWWVLCQQLAQLLQVRAGTVTHFIDSLHVYTPEAAFYDEGRVERALMTAYRPATGLWPLPVTDLAELRAALLEVRALVEGLNETASSPGVQRLVERLK